MLIKERTNKTFASISPLRIASGFFLFFACCVTSVKSQPPLQYRIEAAFLFNFTKFIDWPETAFNSVNSPFIIGILGDDPFGNFLDEIVKNEKINSHVIKVERYKDVGSVAKCQILFVNSEMTEEVEEFLKNPKYQGILTVGNNNVFLKQGGIIRFYTEENKIRLEINIASAKAAQIAISSKLLALAKIY